MRQTHYFVDGQAVDQLPNSPGVYRFYGDGPVPLYIGKSLHIARRLREHMSEAAASARHRRLMDSTQRVDCTLTAGDIGAQLLENREIKRELPLFNRRQRRARHPVTLHLVDAPGGEAGFLRPEVRALSAGSLPDTGAHYGLFRQRRGAEDYLIDLSRRCGLCQRVLGLDRGRGPCFAHQLGQCRGACVGREPAAQHNQRLLAALAPAQLAAWPWPHAVLLREQAPEQGRTDWHLVDQWQHLGSFPSLRHLPRRALAASPAALDLDAYRILLRAFRQPDAQLYAYRPGGKPRAVPLTSPTYSVWRAPATGSGGGAGRTRAVE
ncbi:GIY-YIG nuclease family protein [Haliea atlantica]|nr:nucleotide excision repair endonuclease [Haliea sp.]